MLWHIIKQKRWCGKFNLSATARVSGRRHKKLCPCPMEMCDWVAFTCLLRISCYQGITCPLGLSIENPLFSQPHSHYMKWGSQLGFPLFMTKHKRYISHGYIWYCTTSVFLKGHKGLIRLSVPSVYIEHVLHAGDGGAQEYACIHQIPFSLRRRPVIVFHFIWLSITIPPIIDCHLFRSRSMWQIKLREDMSLAGFVISSH